MKSCISFSEPTVGEWSRIDGLWQVTRVEGGCSTPRAFKLVIVSDEVVDSTSYMVFVASNESLSRVE